jgi:hypothetical protein
LLSYPLQKKDDEKKKAELKKLEEPILRHKQQGKGDNERLEGDRRRKQEATKREEDVDRPKRVETADKVRIAVGPLMLQ